MNTVMYASMYPTMSMLWKTYKYTVLGIYDFNRGGLYEKNHNLDTSSLSCSNVISLGIL